MKIKGKSNEKWENQKKIKKKSIIKEKTLLYSKEKLCKRSNNSIL